MPKNFTLFAVLFLISFYVNGQIKWLNPQPTGYACNKIVFTDANNGFIFNVGGNLLKTNNQGATWEVAHTFSNMQYFDLYDSTGVVAGPAGFIYLSRDNGVSWQMQSTGINSPVILIDIVSRDTFFLTTASKIYKTNDRGETWQLLNYTNNQIKSIDFINSNLGFVGRSSYAISKTSDGGLTWQDCYSVNTIPSTFITIKFLNTDTGYAFKEHSSLLKTTNSGATWTETNMGDHIFTMSFPNDTTGYISGQYGMIYRTLNAGSTWDNISPVNSRIYDMDINSLYFVSKDTGFAVGLRGRILKTVNGGTTWQPYSFFYYDFTAFAFPGTQTGYAISGQDAYKTIDGAKTWSKMPFTFTTPNSNTGSFSNVYFFSADTGLLVANNWARFYKTNDGGQSWTIIKPMGAYSYDRIAGLSFINDSTGFATLLSGPDSYSLCKTKDRGDTWVKVDGAKYSYEMYTNIQFVDEITGYAIRYNLLYKTTGGAINWTQWYDNNSQIQALCFINEKTGYIGDYNGLKKTNDSGRTWNPISIPYFDKDIANIKFMDEKRGWFTSASGAIYQTVDSGSTWALYGKLPTVSRQIAFGKDSIVYLGGTYGTIVSALIDSGSQIVTSCAGNNFTLFSNVAGTSYTWQVDMGNGFSNVNNDAIYSGVNTNTLIINSPPAAWAGYKFRCMVGSYFSNVYDLQFGGYWTGDINDEWENPGNWACGMVPDFSTNVVIPGGHSVRLHSNATVYSLKINPGASFIVDPGYKLVVTH